MIPAGRRETTRPRLLVLTTTFPARPGDGTPEFVLSLAQAVADAFEVTVLAPRVREAVPVERIGAVSIRRFPYFLRPWEGLADGAIISNLKAQRWRLFEAPFLVASFCWHALRLAKGERPDVVHAHWIVPGGMVALVLKRLYGVPYVLTVHGADAYALRGPFFGWLKRRVTREAHTVSPVSRDIASSLGPLRDQAADVVPMGVEVDSFELGFAQRSPVPGRFLFVGRLAEKKGVDVLIRALAGVPEATLVVVGDGPERPSLEALARNEGVEPRVRFLGKLGRSGVMEELRLAHALVIPSKVARGGDQEGTPVVMAEGMAAGVPIVASRLGGLPEYIESGVTGLLVEPGSVAGLSDALRQAMADPKALRSYAERARESVRGTLDMPIIGRRYREFLQAAARSDRSPGEEPRLHK